jgi:hypothetical protein
MRDLSELPTRSGQHKVTRQGTTMYTDRKMGQVVIVYSPVGDKRLEYAMFCMR